jgi:hypothetical protein
MTGLEGLIFLDWKIQEAETSFGNTEITDKDAEAQMGVRGTLSAMHSQFPSAQMSTGLVELEWAEFYL